MRTLAILLVLALAPGCLPIGSGSSGEMPITSRDPDEDAPDNTTVTVVAATSLVVVGALVFLGIRHQRRH